MCVCFFYSTEWKTFRVTEINNDAPGSYAHTGLTTMWYSSLLLGHVPLNVQFGVQGFHTNRVKAMVSQQGLSSHWQSACGNLNSHSFQSSECSSKDLTSWFLDYLKLVSFEWERAVFKMGKDTAGVFSNNMVIKEAGLGRVILGRFVSPEQCLELVIII